MTDPTHPLSDADAEAVSTYLGGEMPAEDVPAFEARLAAEPALAHALDALAEALMTLQGVHDAEPPDGFEQRLAVRLEREHDSAPAATADLSAFRERRASRSRAWLGIGTAAAVLAAGALMSGTVLRGMGGAGGSAEDVALEAGDGGMEATRLESDRDAGGDAAMSAPAEGPLGGPVLLDERAVVADEEALRRRYRSLPEANAVLGLALPDARPLAQRFTAAVEAGEVSLSLQSSPVTAGGGTGTADDAGGSESAEAQKEPASAEGQDTAGRSSAEDPCLAAITADAGAPLVPVRVETLRYDGADAIAYVLVTATPGAKRLDRTEVWVVAPDCSTLVFQQY